MKSDILLMNNKDRKYLGKVYEEMIELKLIGNLKK